MSGFANFNGQGAIYLCETGTGDAVLNGGIVAETQGNLNSFLPATVQITPADLTVLSQKLTLTFSPNVGRTNLTGIVGVKFAMAASATYNMIGFQRRRDAIHRQSHRLPLRLQQPWRGTAATGDHQLRSILVGDPVRLCAHRADHPDQRRILLSWRGWTETNGDPISWGDQRATTLAVCRQPGVHRRLLSTAAGAPVAGSAGMQYHGVDLLDKIDVYGALVVGQSDQTLAGAGAVPAGGVTGALNLAQANQGLTASGGAYSGRYAGLDPSAALIGRGWQGGCQRGAERLSVSGSQRCRQGDGRKRAQRQPSRPDPRWRWLGGAGWRHRRSQPPRKLHRRSSASPPGQRRNMGAAEASRRREIQPLFRERDQRRSQPDADPDPRRCRQRPLRWERIAVTQADQVLAGIARSTVGASLNLRHRPHRRSQEPLGRWSTGSLGHVAQPAQTILASGALKVTGTLSANQQPQTLVGAGAAASPDCIGTLQPQLRPTRRSTATPRLRERVGALSVTQADQALNGHAGTILTGALASRTISTSTPRATLWSSGELNLSQPDQSLSATGRVPRRPSRRRSGPSHPHWGGRGEI